MTSQFLLDIPLAIAVDGSGEAIVTGQTLSTNFPTAAPSQASNAGSNDAVVAALTANLGTLLAGTYLGGRR